jgi:hypothetical protein
MKDYRAMTKFTNHVHALLSAMPVEAEIDVQTFQVAVLTDLNPDLQEILEDRKEVWFQQGIASIIRRALRKLPIVPEQLSLDLDGAIQIGAMKWKRTGQLTFEQWEQCVSRNFAMIRRRFDREKEDLIALETLGRLLFDNARVDAVLDRLRQEATKAMA